MKRLLKYFILFFVLLNLGYSANAKPVPPGSGEGDVPANILFLLDSSASMDHGVANQDILGVVANVLPDSNGDYLVTQTPQALIKYNNDLTRNRDFNDGVGRFTGNINQTCAAVHDGTATGYTEGTKDTRITNSVLTRLAVGLSTNDNKVQNENVVFIRSGADVVYNDEAILGLSEDGTTCLFYLKVGFLPQNHEYRRIGGEDFLFVSGEKNNRGHFTSFNLNTGEKSRIQGGGRRHYLNGLKRVWRGTVNNDGTMYYGCKNRIFGYSLTKVGNVYETTGRDRQYNFVNSPNLDTQLAKVTDCDISADDGTIMYSISQHKAVLQKIQLTTTDSTYTIIERAGTYNSKPWNLEGAGTLAADSVRFKKVHGLIVNSDEIVVTSRDGQVDIFNENLFTAADVDTSWQKQFGGGNMTRWIGLKKAIAAVLSDTTLTTGAHFGYGHWNAGQHGGGRDTSMGGRRCHRNQDQCSYYGGWDGVHPEGRSVQCNNDSCLEVAISAAGKDNILDALLPQVTAWGTDGRAYSQMARHYFLEDFDAYDPDSECQLNYVIVIGDGMINNWDKTDALPYIEELRDQSNPIKTIFIAYGGNINTAGMTRFESLAVAGSCPEGDDTSDDCYGAIEAETPAQLKQELSRLIRQILAEKLSFTAPSITATVQEGGSIYQAQFAYEQYGEWQGTILRKTLNDDGTVDHDMTTAGNWDAGKQLLAQASAADTDDTRYIWTAYDGLTYIGNWNNFTIANSDTIGELFGELEYEVLDYHNTTSYCATRGHVGTDGTDDDILGLINFIRGSDYFDYNGDCNVTEKREHVLGDIYHSQLIEIGPPDGSLDFTGTNEEAYFRVINNYQGFIQTYEGRDNVIYAGANDGMLHAFNAATGDEEWAFIPPFIAAILPTIFNPELSGKVPESCPEPTDPPADPPVPCKDDGSGGTNAIFGVDGSPVVHDVFIRGYDEEGNLEEEKNWHTILFVPYGRGGAGFSVLDVTYPFDPDAGTGPIHMYSVFNDMINQKVMIADRDGDIREIAYTSGSVNIGDSLEAQKVNENLKTALDADGGLDSGVTTEQDAIAECQTNDDVTGGFIQNGTASCFQGTKFTFDIMRPASDDDGTVALHTLVAVERIGGVMTPITLSSAKMDTGQFVVEFPAEKTFNPGGSTEETAVTTAFNISHSCTSSNMTPGNKMYDYSQLGETWSSPRIARLPSPKTAERDNPAFDTYVAIMGAGMGNTSLCAGSAVFLVNLDYNAENEEKNPYGVLYGYEENGGPIIIVDTDSSDIGNSLPSSAVVITPDTAPNVPWRGAMVYFNDLEGKITKINLTTSTENSAELFDQTTLFTLRADTQNKRYSYFSMDAGIGADTRDLWLFGGTGDFTDIGSGSSHMDNILYGIKDPHYPHFAHLNGVHIPSITEASFVDLAIQGAEDAKKIDESDDDGKSVDSVDCTNATDLLTCIAPSEADYPKFAWRIHLDDVDYKQPSDESTTNTYRKISASPTLFEGNVYFPIYQPPPGAASCNVGMAYICVANDECGSNNSHLLTAGGDPSSACKEIREGILSRLIIFGDMLYANVAGPSKDEDTLYSIIAAAGEASSRRSTWRDGGF